MLANRGLKNSTYTWSPKTLALFLKLHCTNEIIRYAKMATYLEKKKTSKIIFIQNLFTIVIHRRTCGSGQLGQLILQEKFI